MIAKALNAEQFIDQRYDLPDAGQWAELHAGEVVLLEPPDDDYGNVVRNLSQMLASYIQQHRLGYACFDLGLLAQTKPDTLLFPAACFYRTDDLFAQSDVAFTQQMPQLVIEIVSTHDRRQQARQRSELFLECGVESVCHIDPRQQSCDTFTASQHFQVKGEELWEHPKTLPHFQMTISDLFVLPEWWTG